MPKSLDVRQTLDIIERLRLARIGEYDKWEAIVKKLKHGIPLNSSEYEYFANISRTYKGGRISSHTKIYHIKLSEIDEKPPCKTCGTKSLFYCNMNDAYFCSAHVVGHDENEI